MALFQQSPKCYTILKLSGQCGFNFWGPAAHRGNWGHYLYIFPDKNVKFVSIFIMFLNVGHIWGLKGSQNHVLGTLTPWPSIGPFNSDGFGTLQNPKRLSEGQLTAILPPQAHKCGMFSINIIQGPMQWGVKTLSHAFSLSNLWLLHQILMDFGLYRTLKVQLEAKKKSPYCFKWSKKWNLK